MSIKPIRFTAEEVRATLDGRKTVKRLVVKPQPALESHVYPNVRISDELYVETWEDGTVKQIKPPYRPGDILYVRETWAAWSRTEGLAPTIHYKADEENLPSVKWRPSIHMPREAARIFLRVTGVRVERLQEIDEDGAIAEGLYKGWSLTQTSTLAETARQAFVWLWQHLTRKAPVWQGWAANPWVWVIEFERCEKPEAI